jgi:prepilin-type N-terminal cleavage/methylation domain-containing protein
MTDRRPAGFTLIELLVALALIGVLAWTAYPRLDAVQEIRLDAAARRVTADLRYAQSWTIGARIVHGVRFEPAAAAYTVFARTPDAAVTDPADRSRVLRVDVASRWESRGVSIESAEFGSTAGVAFDYLGVPRDLTGRELDSPGRVVLRYGDATDTVEVAPGTGRVTVR